MRGFVYASAIAIGVALAGSGTVTAEKEIGQPDTSQNTPKDDQLVGTPNMEKEAHTAKNLPEIRVPGGSPQTMPSTISPANAAADARWWLDRGTALTDGQKRAIYRAIASAGTQSARRADDDPGPGIYAEASTELPPSVRLHDLPADLVAQIPFLRDFRYVTADGKVLLIDPNRRTVATVIEQ